MPNNLPDDDPNDPNDPDGGGDGPDGGDDSDDYVIMNPAGQPSRN